MSLKQLIGLPLVLPAVVCASASRVEASAESMQYLAKDSKPVSPYSDPVKKRNNESPQYAILDNKRNDWEYSFVHGERKI